MSNVKTFDVDWNDFSSVNSAFQKLKARKVDLDAQRISRKDKTENFYNACAHIWRTHDPVGRGCYYVYAHCDPERPLTPKNRFYRFGIAIGLTQVPFYIGKGCGNRCFDLNRNGEHRKTRQRINRSGNDVIVKVLVDEMDEQSAFSIECRLIDIFGIRSYGGILVNLDEGHDHISRKHSYADAFEVLHKGVLGEYKR